MRLDQQIQRLYEQLERELDSFPAGSRFYSLHEIAAKFRVHRRVIDGALNRMKRSGLIGSVPRIGYFSRVTRNPGSLRVLLAEPDWPSGTTGRWSCAAMQYAEQHDHWTLIRRLYNGEQQELSAISARNVDALMVRYWHSRFSDDDMRWLSEQSIPVVMLGMDVGDFEISSVCSDDGAGAILACGHLHRRGHRNVLMVISEPGRRIREWCRNFPVTAELFGMKCTVLDCQMENFTYARNQAYEAVRSYLLAREGKADFSAIYVIAGESAPGVMKAVREFGYQIPRDISILAHSDEADGEFIHPPLSLVAFDLNAEVEAAFRGIRECLQGKYKSFHVKLPMRIIERDSVAMRS